MYCSCHFKNTIAIKLLYGIIDSESGGANLRAASGVVGAIAAVLLILLVALVVVIVLMVLYLRREKEKKSITSEPGTQEGQKSDYVIVCVCACVVWR